jgi:hypothetical protein
VWLGTAGTGAAVAGGYFLWLASPAPLGLGLLAAAAVMFMLDAFVDTAQIVGTAATAALALGFTKLIVGLHGIRPGLAVSGCLALGAITMALNWAARRARRNKRLDVFGRQ